MRACFRSVFYPVAGMVTLAECFAGAGSSPELVLDSSAQDAPPTEKNRHYPGRSQKQEASGGRLQEFRSR